jgi:hypothetical protein
MFTHGWAAFFFIGEDCIAAAQTVMPWSDTTSNQLLQGGGFHRLDHEVIDPLLRIGANPSLRLSTVFGRAGNAESRSVVAVRCSPNCELYQEASLLSAR